MRTELRSYEPDTQREDEAAREQQWEEFIGLVRDYRACGVSFGTLIHEAAIGLGWSRDPEEMEQGFPAVCRAFAETESWSGVLSAIARAMREDEQARRELVDRR